MKLVIFDVDGTLIDSQLMIVNSMNAGMAEAGLPGFEFRSWYGLWAPKGTPAEICQRVNTLMQETMREHAIVQRLTTQVLEPVTESIEETKRFIAAEITRAGELLRSVNYEPV